MKFNYLDNLNRPSHCFIELFYNNDKIIVVCTNDDYRPVMSITNAAENLNAALKKTYGEDVIHIEHYDDGNGEFDLVTVENGQAHWKRLTEKELEEYGIYILKVSPYSI